MMKTFWYAFFFNLFSCSQGLLAQSLPVGTTGLEEYYRRKQLLGKLDSSLSFLIRPILSSDILGSKYIFDPYDKIRDKPFLNISRSIPVQNTSADSIVLLPVTWLQQYTTDHPYGWNDGAIIPSRGYQTLVSFGLYGKFKRLSIQFRPELVFAQNKYFDQFPTEHYDAAWINYYRFYNNIDLPERFGERSYSKVFLGQSSVRLNFSQLSFGLSNENLWWGPGIYSSLLMTNSAPGFLHFTFNTNKPVKTAIGSFEGQFIAGRLVGSGFTPPEPNRTVDQARLYYPKVNDGRYISGLTFNYQPKWLPGLFLGFSRTSQIYFDDISDLGDLVPLFSSFKKVTADNEEASVKSNLSSMFFRWLLPKARAEVYFEYGRSDHSRSYTDFRLQPERSRAYLFGIQKLVPLNKTDQYIQVNIESTQLQQALVDEIRNAESWYTSSYVRHGYTHRGESLGAGIGPGGSLQTLDITWVKQLKSIGLKFERNLHNNDFYYYTFGDYRIHWVDISAAAHANWNYRNLLFNARLQMIRSLNYQWWFRQYDPNNFYVSGRDVLNYQLALGVSYRF